MRVLHFSDIHLALPFLQVPLEEWLGKRAVGGLNLLFGRQRRFKDNVRKLEALDRFRRSEAIDLVVCTGDYTAMGLERELAMARSVVQPLMDAPLGFVNVPGNHDLYVTDVVREGRFDRHFGDTLASDLPEYRAEGPWPMVRLVDPEVGVVAVNSARPNPLPWRSNGFIPELQLSALADVLHDTRVRSRFVFIVTHYAPRLSDGGPDRRLHGLINADALLEVCAAVPRGAILCGHVHHRFHVRLPGVNPAIFCAGSTTMAGREGLWVYEVAGDRAQAIPGRWNEDAYVLVPSAAVQL